MPNDAIVMCTFGDASINHSTAVGAVNSALWVAHQDVAMPLVFICEDNGIGISVPTPSSGSKASTVNDPDCTTLEATG